MPSRFHAFADSGAIFCGLLLMGWGVSVGWEGLNEVSWRNVFVSVGALGVGYFLLVTTPGEPPPAERSKLSLLEEDDPDDPGPFPWSHTSRDARSSR